MLTVAVLFAGCGGTALGYLAEDYRVAYACEWDPLAAQTFELNLRIGVDRRDIRDVSGEEIIRACGCVPDVLDFSSPCGDFTPSGAHDPEGDRAALLREVPRLVGEVEPRAFALENVPGLLGRKMRRRHFDPLAETLRGLGADLAWDVLDASWHGVAQARRRVLLAGACDLGAHAADAIPPRQSRRTVIGDALPGVAAVVAAPSWHFRRRFGRRVWYASDPLATVTTGGVAYVYEIDRLQVWLESGARRAMAVEDLAALCGFPRWFRLPPGVGKADAWRMFGNCVPPPLAAAWARSIAEALSRRA